MPRTHITVPTPVIVLALLVGLFGGIGYEWLGSGGAGADAGHVFDVGVADAAAASSTPIVQAEPAPVLVATEPVVTKPVVRTPPVKKPIARKPVREQSAEKFLPMRLLADESTAGPGTAGILRRKRGEYAGRLIPIDRTSACPRVAMAFFRMRADAQRNGVKLRVVNGFRTKTHQRRLYRELGPVYAAPPGKSLHRRATELDIAMKPGGVDRTYRWLVKHGGRYGFVQRYSWEPWHWGYVRGC